MNIRNLCITLIWMATPIMLIAQDTNLEVEEGAVLFHGTTGSTPVSGAGTRMMWIPDKGAFRAGEVTGTQWDADSIGSGSFVGGGQSSMASGVNSFVGGGFGNTAFGEASLVGGSFNSARGQLSSAVGGSGNDALSLSSFVGGGQNNIASGAFSFVGGGQSNTASGSRSFVGGGRNLLAKSYGETVFGNYNTDYTPNSAGGIDAADRLFVIGNGTGPDSRSNAMTVMKNGRVGIGNSASNPSALLHVAGGGALFEGTTGSTPVSGAGVRMMWVPDKAAFRAGIVDGTQWDVDNIGIRSFASGDNNTASAASSFVGGGQYNAVAGESSFVGGGRFNEASGASSFVGGGEDNTASADYSFVGGGDYNTASGIESFVGGGRFNGASGASSFVGGGDYNTASADYSFVGGGDYNTASGIESFVGGGSGNTASGSRSFVGGGRFLMARSYGEAVFGTYNTDYTPASATTINAADRLFVIGNGTAIGNRSNAVTVMKNGRVGIGDAASTPGYLLDVAGNLNLNKSITSGVALRVNESEALWYDGTYFSWGFGGAYNRFADPIRIGGIAEPTHTLEVEGSAAKTDGASWSVLSDARLKTVNGPYDKGLEAIGSLKPIRFQYIKDNPYQMDAETEQIGFIAQEVQPIFPEAVTMLKDGYLSFNMHSINVALVNAVKELKDENDILREEVTQLNSSLTTENKILKSEIENLKKLEGQLAKITSALTELGINLDPVP